MSSEERTAGLFHMKFSGSHRGAVSRRRLILSAAVYSAVAFILLSTVGLMVFGPSSCVGGPAADTGSSAYAPVIHHGGRR